MNDFIDQFLCNQIDVTIFANSIANPIIPTEMGYALKIAIRPAIEKYAAVVERATAEANTK